MPVQSMFYYTMYDSVIFMYKDVTDFIHVYLCLFIAFGQCSLALQGSFDSHFHPLNQEIIILMTIVFYSKYAYLKMSDDKETIEQFPPAKTRAGQT